MASKRVLVAYDGSGPSKKAIEVVRNLAKVDDQMEVTFVYVMRLFSSGSAAVGMDTLLADEVGPIKAELDAIVEELPVESEVVVLKGTSPADLILNCARERESDLIVMGSRGQSGVKGYLGSVSYAVVKNSPVTVMIAKD